MRNFLGLLKNYQRSVVWSAEAAALSFTTNHTASLLSEPKFHSFFRGWQKVTDAMTE
jgi:hypothetical protein